MKPVAYIDLFCGMGGFSLGANRAGATSILAVDSWGEAIDVHRTNFPKDPIRNFKLGMDHQINYFETLTRRWKERGYHVHIHGSPPCQALSNASTTDSSKGMPLVHWFLQLVYRCDPDSWSMENVVPVRKKLPENIPSVILNAADFGVPQTRRRCFAGHGWVAEPTHSKEKWISVVQALPHLKEELDNLVPAPSMIEQYKTADKSKPYPTITSQSPQQLRLRLWHEKPMKIRSLTMSETLILQGFPSNFDLSAAKTKKSRWTMVGNAVCPPVAEALIRGIQND